MPILKRKVFAYITHGDRLLVFTHPHAPEAGVQVPSGTVEDGERPEDAVLREAREETGLTGLMLADFLGEQFFDYAPFGRDEIHHRRFYHLRYDGTPPDTWEHYEDDPSDGSGRAYLFALSWARLHRGLQDLIPDHGIMLPRLLEVSSRQGTSSG
jgi:8-oxo-dGTP pyrophosphatase MutT (NUDIX family)